MNLPHVGPVEVIEQSQQCSFQGRYHLLSIDSAAVLEQHRAFLDDEIVDRLGKPSVNALARQVLPSAVFGEEPFEQAMGQAALEHGAVGDLVDPAASKAGRVSEHPLVRVVADFVQARVGLGPTGRNRSVDAPPSPGSG